MMKNTEEVFDYLDKAIKSDFRYFLPKIVDRVYLCVESGKPAFTDFLDPMRLQYATNMLAGLEKFGIIMTENGGHGQAERKMLGFGFEKLTIEDFPISKIELTYDSKFKKLFHNDFLGAVISLGVDRSVIGDIVPLVDSWVIIMNSKLSDFVHTNLYYVSNMLIKARLLPKDYEIFGLDNKVTETIVCSSLKLVKILATTFNLSRQHANTLIQNRMAFVNWVVEDHPSCLIKTGDTISLRTHGKFQIKKILGKSKKDNFIIEIVKY